MHTFDKFSGRLKQRKRLSTVTSSRIRDLPILGAMLYLAALCDATSARANLLEAYGQFQASVLAAAIENDIENDSNTYTPPYLPSSSTSTTASETGTYGGVYSVPLSASANGSSFASYGVLRAAVSGSASADYSAIPIYGVGEVAESVYAAFESDATALYDDEIILTSATEAYGSPVLLTFSFSLHDIASSDGSATTLAALSYYASGSSATLGAVYNQLGDNDLTGLLNVNAYVGETVTFGAALEMETYGCGYRASYSCSASVDALDTSYTSISVSDLDVTYTADSGTIYPTSLPAEVSDVPEPTSLALLSMGLIGFGALRQRRRMEPVS